MKRIDKNVKIILIILVVVASILAIFASVKILFFKDDKVSATKEISIKENNISPDDDKKEDKEDSDSEVKTVKLFNRTDIENMTGTSTVNISATHEALSKESSWEKAGYDTTTSKKIAKRISHSKNQSYGVIRGIANENKSLKIITIAKDDDIKINFGSEK